MLFKNSKALQFAVLLFVVDSSLLSYPLGNYKGRLFLRRLRKIRVTAAARHIQSFWRKASTQSLLSKAWTGIMKKLRILLVFANPHRTSPLRLQSEERAIREALSGSYYEFLFSLPLFEL